MKKLIIFLLLTAICGKSQNKKEIKDFFWGNNDNYKNAIKIPEKWKNESAVLILKLEYYDYHKFGKSAEYSSGIRKRIKLLDQSAVTEFSEFSYSQKFKSNKGLFSLDSNNFFGVKIIKPDGKEIEIDVEKNSKKVDTKSKIAIPGLEVGDVIDYYFYSIEAFKSIYQVSFDPEETTLSDVYPIMDFELTFQSENDFYVNFNSYNGCPDLVQVPTKKSNERKYELKAKDLEKNEFPKWFYPLVELPSYKFQVVLARKNRYAKDADSFLSESEKEVKKTVSKEEILEFYKERFEPSGSLDLENQFLKDKNFASDEEKIREVYYYARHEFYTQFIEATIIQKANIFYPFGYYEKSIFFQYESSFICHFMNFLKKNNISYDIVIATERSNGPINDLLLQSNVKHLLRINTKKPFFLEYFSPFTSADQFNYNLENTKAYVLNTVKGKKVESVEEIILPSTTAKENNSLIKTTAVLNPDFSGMMVNRNSSITGHLKEAEQSSRMEFYDYVNEDYEKYGTKHVIDMVRNKKDKERFRKEFTALIDKFKEKQKEENKKSISAEFDFEIDNSNFKIKNTGRFGSKTPFEYQEDFEIKNHLVKKAGENIIIEIGKLITSQIAIDDKEKTRKNNIYMPFPRSFNNEISFTIPTGYTVSGIEKLNKNVTNECGGFVSSAALNGDKLIIKTFKSYENYYDPNKNWEKIILFLDAAYQFTQEKILLKKQ
jgi:hypothetical protein